jgi:N-methylhydantoinase B
MTTEIWFSNPQHPQRAKNVPKIDVVLTEIIRNRLVAATEEMAKTLVRTAYNPVLYEVQDFSVTILSASGEMWAETPGVIVFSQGFPEAVRAGIRRRKGQFNEGDVLVVNDPFETGTHISDTNVYMPVFFKGELVAFAGVAAHWADIGGHHPGGWSPDTTDLYQEGLCFRHQRLVVGGVKNDDLWELIADNVRIPRIVTGDLEAQIAACRQGSERIRALCGKYGASAVRNAMEHVIEQTDIAMRRAVSGLPDGEFGASIRLDSDGIQADGEFLVCLKVTIHGDRVRFSLDGSSPAARGPVNLPAVGTAGILASSLKGILMPFDPCNAGHTMCCDFDIPQGSIVGPTRPAPTDSYGYLVVCLMELMFRCFAAIVPTRCPAGGYQLTGSVLSRSHAQAGEPFVMFDPTHGGNGALQQSDGQTNQLIGNGDLPNSPLELPETRYPVRIKRLELAPEVAGRGRFRGGMGITKDYELLSNDISVSFVIENTNDPTARGVDGGADGRHGSMIINPEGPSAILVSKRVATMGPYEAGTIVRAKTGGGGGWGPPAERDPELVLADVRNEFLDASAASDLYGVAIFQEGGKWRIDADRTRELRAGGL